MSRVVSLVLCLLLPPAVASAAPLDRAALRERFGRTGEDVWRTALEPEKHNPRVSTFFNHALTLCETGLHPERLEKLFALAATRQDLDPKSETYGSFRWSWNDTEVTDRNAIEFCMQPAAIVWLKHRDALPPAAREKLRALLDPAVQASLTHKVAPSYTNIALMSAGNLIALGEGLVRSDVADEGYRRLQAIYDLTLRKGISEYLSPTYYGVNLNALQLMDTFAARPAGQRQARALLEYLWTEIAANYWWANQRVAGAHSRDYDYLHGQGGLEGHLAAAGFLNDGTPPTLIPSIAAWQPPADLIAFSRSKLPRLVRRQWGWGPRQAVTPTVATRDAGFRYDGTEWASYTHWLARDVTLSISGSLYGPIDVPFTVDFAGSRHDVRGYFIPDGRHDPYGKIEIPWRGHPKAVHLQPFFAGVQQTQDALALVVYRESDVPAESQTLESHFVMPRQVDAVYVGERVVRFEKGKPQSIALASGEPVYLRKGTAVVAIRSPAARTVGGTPAPAALVWDNNAWEAIRFTVDHRLGAAPTKVRPAAALHVRVGSGLDEAGFADFRRTFAAATYDVAMGDGKISLGAPTHEAGPRLRISAAAPWAKPLDLFPASSAELLEIDGKDVGRRILAGTP